jgi:hypothetical protein
VLASTDLSSGTPVLGQPTAGFLQEFSANSLSSGAPVLGQPTITQFQGLASSPLVAGAPVLGQPSLVVQYNLAADDLDVSAPVLGEPIAGTSLIFVIEEHVPVSPVLSIRKSGSWKPVTAAWMHRDGVWHQTYTT